jgi:hypothetical protein
MKQKHVDIRHRGIKIGEIIIPQIESLGDIANLIEHHYKPEDLRYLINNAIRTENCNVYRNSPNGRKNRRIAEEKYQKRDPWK